MNRAAVAVVLMIMPAIIPRRRAQLYCFDGGARGDIYRVAGSCQRFSPWGQEWHDRKIDPKIRVTLSLAFFLAAMVSLGWSAEP